MRNHDGGKVLAVDAGVRQRLAVAHRLDVAVGNLRGNRSAVTGLPSNRTTTSRSPAPPNQRLADLVGEPPAFERHAGRAVEPIRDAICGASPVLCSSTSSCKMIAGIVRRLSRLPAGAGCERVPLDDFQIQFRQARGEMWPTSRRVPPTSQLPVSSSSASRLASASSERLAVECRSASSGTKARSTKSGRRLARRASR